MKGLLHRISIIVLLVLVSACGILVEKDRQIIAEVGKDPVRLQDLLRRIRGLPFQERARTNDSNASIRIETRRAILRAIVSEKLLSQEAEARGITVSEEEAVAALNQEIAGDIHSDDEVTDETMEGAGAGHEHSHDEEEGHTKKEIDSMRQQLMTQKLLQTVLSEEAIRKYYDENIKDFALPVPLLTVEMVAAENENRAAIVAIRKKAKREGMSLLEALDSLEDAPPFVFAGLTSMPLDQIEPNMRNNLLHLKVGQVSRSFDLLSSESHLYAVIRLVEVITHSPFDEVKGQAQTLLYRKFLGELEEKHKVVYYNEKLDYRLGE